jgi:hypothetical protein
MRRERIIQAVFFALKNPAPRQANLIRFTSLSCFPVFHIKDFRLHFMECSTPPAKPRLEMTMEPNTGIYPGARRTLFQLHHIGGCRPVAD